MTKGSNAQHEVPLYLRAAHEALDAAQKNFEMGLYRTATGRMYYAVFYAVTALLKAQGLTFSKHTAVLSAFRQRFIKTGIFRKEFSDLYKRLFDLRQVSDYDVVTPLDVDEVRRQFPFAEELISEIEIWLRQHHFLQG